MLRFIIVCVAIFIIAPRIQSIVDSLTKLVIAIKK